MSNEEKASSSSFTHAFLPGLILGIIIGAVVATFLPAMSGPKIPAPTAGAASGTAPSTTPRDRQPDPAQIGQDEQDLIDAAIEGGAETATDESLENATEQLEQEIQNNTPEDDG